MDEFHVSAVVHKDNRCAQCELRRATEGFLARLFRQGAFVGSAPDDAYFVRVDRTTMTQDDIDAGRLNILIGFAPIKPAEFVIVRIQLRSGT